MKDHLGNTRVIFTDSNNDGTPEIIQESDYYPFGMMHDNNTTATNHYLYNGKELDTDLGLNWYHYGARMYDPAYAKFTGVDPISDQFPWVSTYNYAENEPVGSIDLHGLQRLRVTGSQDRRGGYRTWERYPTQPKSGGLIERAATLETGARYPSIRTRVGHSELGGTNITSISARVAANLTNALGELGQASDVSAFRHAFWVSSMADQLGEDVAIRAANAHEGFFPFDNVNVDFSQPFEGSLELADAVADVLNNEIGLTINGTGTIDRATQVLEVFQSEGLWTASDDGEGNITIGRTKIKQEQFDEAIQILNTLDENGLNEANRRTLQNRNNENN